MGVVAAGLLSFLIQAESSADERRFGYTYEPETMLRGGMEFEQWVTLRSQRSRNVGQQNFNRWEIREALEYGVTDNYTVELYLNSRSETFRHPQTGNDHSKFSFDGVSVENRYMVLNPAAHKVGLSLYLEPRFSGDEAEIEEKIIVGQRYGNWKWALNLTHATEWSDNFHATEGEVEMSTGWPEILARAGRSALNCEIIVKCQSIAAGRTQQCSWDRL